MLKKQETEIRKQKQKTVIWRHGKDSGVRSGLHHLVITSASLNPLLYRLWKATKFSTKTPQFLQFRQARKAKAVFHRLVFSTLLETARPT